MSVNKMKMRRETQVISPITETVVFIMAVSLGFACYRFFNLSITATSLISMLVIVSGVFIDVPTNKLKIISAVMGLCLGINLSQVSFHPDSALAWFGTMIFTFHQTEFLLTSIYHPMTVNYSNFLLKNGLPYPIMISLAFIEKLFIPYPRITSNLYFILALTLALTGLATRLFSVWQAGFNFTHILREARHQRHTLVTSGLYSIVRHPSYAGWIVWVLGSQLMLCNIVSFVLYVVACRVFFNDRVKKEEKHLLDLFGSEYAAYRDRVPHGLWLFVD